MNKKNRFRLNLTLILLIFSVILVVAAVPAVYAPSVHWWITSLADAHSSISPLGVTQVNNGLNQAYSFSANTGYYISSVLVDGSPVSTTSPYTFTDVLENHTIAVSSSPLVSTVSITFTSNPSGSGFITVNGVAEVTPYNIPSATVGATYTLDANSPVAGTTGVQYVFGSWGSTSIGTQTSASYVYTVPSTGETVTASYTTQYQLTVTSSYGSPTGAGWYNSGASATFGVTSPASVVSGQSQELFTSWTGSGTGSYSSTLTSTSVTMNNPITETAGWQLQYYLTVTGGNSVSGQGWVNSGTSTTASSSWVWNVVSGESRSAVTNWQLDGTNENPTRQDSGTLTTSSITMSTYHIVNFVSTTQYCLTVTGGNGVTYGAASPTGDNWYDSGMSTTVSSNGVWSRSGGTGQRVASWSLNGDGFVQQIENGGFESGTADWSGISGVASISSSYAHSGTYSLYLEPEDGSGVTQTISNIPVASVSSFNFWAIAPYGSVTTDWIKIFYTDGSSTTYYPSIPTSPWTKFSPTLTSGKTIDEIAFYSGDQSPIYIDDVSLQTFSATPTPVSTTGTVTISSVTMSTYNTIVFNDVTQYQVTLDAGATSALNSITSPTISGDNYWYDSGTSVSLVLNGVYGRLGGSGTRVSGYKINAGSNNPESTTGSISVLNTVSISGVEAVTTTTVTQYQITLDSTSTSAFNSITSPTVSGDNYWYDSGTSVSVVLNGVWGRSGGTGTGLAGYVLNGGSNNPTSTTSTVTVFSGAVSNHEFVTSTSVTQYQLTVTTNFGTFSPATGNWYDSGSSVTLSATAPTAGSGEQYVWNGWSGSGSGSYTGIANPATNDVTMNAPVTESGSWTNQYEIVPSADSHSVISPSSPVWVNAGGSQTFTYSPNNGYSILSVLVDGGGVSITGSYTVSDVTVSHTISVSASINVFYITSSSDSHSTISPSGSTAVNYGGLQAFSFSASAGYSITSVLVDGSPVSLSSPYTFSNVQSNHTISVSTAINVFYITASNDGNSVISPLGTTSVNYGGSQSYTFSANNGYNLTSVLVDGSPVSLSSPYTFTDVQANHTISASSISLAVFYITTFVDGHSTITPFGSIAVYDGYSQQFTFSTSIGYHVVQVLVDGSPVSLSSPYTFSNVHANHTISVSSAIDVFYITSSSDGNSTISPLGLIAVNYGGNQSFSFSAISDYTLVGVLVDGSSVSLTSPYIFTNVQANHTISVRGALSLTPLGLSSSAPLPSGLTVQPIIIGKMQADSNGTLTINVAYGGGGGFTLTNIALPAPFVYWMTPTQSLPLTIINDQNVTFNIAVPKGFTGNLTGIATISGIDPYGKTELATTTISISIEPPSNSGSQLALFGTALGTTQLLVGGIAAFTILVAVALLKKRK